ncbi:MAG TPA: hypothetical protein VFT98_16340 [Myxococcota bacterium]|nr:hypothetical protein [Myxococcota bacterium]
MTVANWVRWNRTELELAEREALLGALTQEQQRQLLHNDYVWVERCGVIWRPREGDLRRARFTHSTVFETKRGAFRIDADGGVHDARSAGARGDPQ